jgi:hypothetical protein
MSTDHSHVNRANNVMPEEDIKPPQTLGTFHLDEAMVESKRIKDM